MDRKGSTAHNLSLEIYQHNLKEKQRHGGEGWRKEGGGGGCRLWWAGMGLRSGLCGEVKQATGAVFGHHLKKKK